MPECKDCISENVCKYADERVSLGTKVRETIHNCIDFKDKSRIVNLPCEVGQKVYLITDKFTKPSELLRVLICRVDEFSVDFKNKTYVVLNAEDAFCSMRRFATINISEFGDKCFVDRADADAKLIEIIGK